jgi:hypothetical protein
MLPTREQQQIQRAVQLDRPSLSASRYPFSYLEMDGTGVPVVRKETAGRHGKTEGQPAHTREVKLGCVFTQIRWDASRTGPRLDYVRSRDRNR